MKQPSIGELRHRIRIESASRTPDGGGGASETWTLLTEAWAAIREPGGRETVTAEALQGEAITEIWLRYRSDVTAAQRVTFGARTFDIRAALDPDGRRRWLRCLCSERRG